LVVTTIIGRRSGSGDLGLYSTILVTTPARIGLPPATPLRGAGRQRRSAPRTVSFEPYSTIFVTTPAPGPKCGLPHFGNSTFVGAAHPG
jgi:hypothetical protein